MLHFAAAARKSTLTGNNFTSQLGRALTRLQHRQSMGLPLAGEFLLLAKFYAARRAALGIAQRADVQIQFPESSTEGVSVHSQYWGGFALVPIGIS